MGPSLLDCVDLPPEIDIDRAETSVTVLLVQLLLNRIGIRVICESTGSERLTSAPLHRSKLLLLLHHRKRDICIVNLLQLLLRRGRLARICRVLGAATPDTIITAHYRRVLLRLKCAHWLGKAQILAVQRGIHGEVRLVIYRTSKHAVAGLIKRGSLLVGHRGRVVDALLTRD